MPLPCLMPLLFPCYCYVIYTIIKELQVNKQLKHVNSLLPNMNSTIMWFWIIKASPLPLQLTKIMKISNKNSNLLYEMLLHIGKILKKRSPKIVQPVHDKYWLGFFRLKNCLQIIIFSFFHIEFKKDCFDWLELWVN